MRSLYVCTGYDQYASVAKGFNYFAVRTLNEWISGLFGVEVMERLYAESPKFKIEYLLKHAGVLVEKVV